MCRERYNEWNYSYLDHLQYGYPGLRYKNLIRRLEKAWRRGQYRAIQHALHCCTFET